MIAENSTDFSPSVEGNRHIVMPILAAVSGLWLGAKIDSGIHLAQEAKAQCQAVVDVARGARTDAAALKKIAHDLAHEFPDFH